MPEQQTWTPTPADLQLLKDYAALSDAAEAAEKALIRKHREITSLVTAPAGQKFGVDVGEGRGVSVLKTRPDNVQIRVSPKKPA